MPSLSDQHMWDAIRDGDTAAAKAWLDDGGSPHLCIVQGPHIETALMAAIRAHQKDIVALLIDSGAALNDFIPTEGGDERNPLMAAISARDMEITKLLLEKGADLHEKNSHGWSPLTYAISHQGSDVFLEYLLTLNPDLNTQSTMRETPLIHAVKNKDFKKVDMLLTAGANPNIAGHKGDTPLMSAIQAQQTDIVRRLLECDIDLNAQNDNGWTATICASADLPETEILSLLLAHKPDINLATSSSKETPLIVAAHHKDFEKMELLLQSGADPNMQDLNGHTALHHVLQSCGTDEQESIEKMTHLLLSYDADPRLTNKAKYNAIDLAAFKDLRHIFNATLQKFQRQKLRQKQHNFRKFIHKKSP